MEDVLAQLTINGQSVEADEGRPLVEVIKEHGVAITNLCYIDGLPPYAGCRTCIVEIEGARPTELQLSCTATVADGMVVNTDTEEVKQSRQSVMSMILANHPDRCLSCHRRVHCAPGEICLRDDVVTHRCLTCSKNYRCELQTSCEIVDMGDFEEPWVGEVRSYYETPPPDPDRGNPYLEFDPQMCIICTRCVRACADLRHTGAIALEGKGHTTMIAFGTGGAIHDSSCDFCGSCIDVCPTATLMEKPNKWVGRAEEWTSSVCNGCSVGCTISYGTVDDRPVIVRPDRINPISRDQICVRGRFGYDAVSDRERLSRSLVRAGDRLLPASPEDAITRAAEAIGNVRSSAGAGAVAVLGSPLATTEEAYLLRRLANDIIGTPHLDSSHGPVHRAVAEALRGAFGTDRLPAALTQLEQADTIVALAGDLEESHQIASLRIKDAVVKRSAQLVVVSARWGELVPFAAAWLRPASGHEAATVQALAAAVANRSSDPAEVPGVDAEAMAAAVTALRAGADGDGAFEVVFAPDIASAARAGNGARAAANLAIAARGDRSAQHVHYLPTEANVLGLADVGVAPGDGGLSYSGIIERAIAGEIKALVIHADNPLLSAPGRTAVEAALSALDALVVIDSVRSSVSEYADVVLAELPFHGEDGTITNADRRILLHRAATGPKSEERAGVAIIGALGDALAGAQENSLSVETPFAITDLIAAETPGYADAPTVWGSGGEHRALDDGPTITNTRNLEVLGEPGEGLALLTGRSLFTSWDGASAGTEDADKLHREEAALVHPQDAEAAGLRGGDDAVLAVGQAELRIKVQLDDGIAAGTTYVPLYYDGGALMRLLTLDTNGAGPATVELRTPSNV
jgi:predicted molibdopterin-dependent oxidoreductase YjgC